MVQEKLVFATRGSELTILELAAQIKQRGIPYSCRHTQSGYGLFVPKDYYHKALVVGNRIINNARIDGVNWADSEDSLHPVGYIPIMEVYLPWSRTDELDWSTLTDSKSPNYPGYLREYLDELKTFCGTKEVRLEYDEYQKKFNVFFMAPFEEYQIMFKRCMGFNRINEHIPFIKISYLNIDNSLNGEVEKLRGQSLQTIESYFYNSLLHDIVKTPESSSIAPHNDDYPRSMGLKHASATISLSDHDCKSDCNSILKGWFLTEDIKTSYDYKGTCCVIDKGDFEVDLTFTPEEVTMKTTVKVRRIVDGIDLEKENLRDGLFTFFKNGESSGTVSYTEHYVLIANGTRLLHYSDEYDFFEIFDLPANWHIENGIFEATESKPKVFDDIDYDQSDTDLEEIDRIIKGKTKGRQLEMKKPKNGEN